MTVLGIAYESHSNRNIAIALTDSYPHPTKGEVKMTEIELIKLAQKRDKQKLLWMLLSSPTYDLAKWWYWADYIRANKN